MFRIAEVRKVQPVAVRRPLEQPNEQVSTVVAHRAADEPRRQIGPREDQTVLGLRRAEAVVVERVVGERSLQGLAWRRLGKP